MGLLFLFAGIALGTSFVCSLLEATLLSVTPSYIVQLEGAGDVNGKRLARLKGDIERSLAAILSVNTVANTAGAAGVGAQAQSLWGSSALAIASAVMTIAVLIVSEIIPKTIGATYWRKLAPFAARVLPALIFISYPLVVLANKMTRSIGRNEPSIPIVSRDEVAAMARLGAEQGVIAESESRILRNLFRFGELRVRDVMTPRTVVFSLSHDTTVREFVENRSAMRFSRIPLFREDEDDVLGYVLKDEVLLYAARDQLERPVADLKRDLLVIPESLPVPGLFETLLDKREHIALAVDEYGGVAGVVTMEDVVETLLGLEIVDEADAVRDMRDLARARWFERARRLGIVAEGASEPPPRTAPPPKGS